MSIMAGDDTIRKRWIERERERERERKKERKKERKREKEREKVREKDCQSETTRNKINTLIVTRYHHDTCNGPPFSPHVAEKVLLLKISGQRYMSMKRAACFMGQLRNVWSERWQECHDTSLFGLTLQDRHVYDIN